MATLARNEEAATGSPIRVLIVDDSIVARAVLRRIIEGDARYRVAAAVADARAALDFLALERVDMILLDIEMPGQDGLAALPAIIAAGHAVPVLIVSTTCASGAEATVRALSLGAADTLVKPGAGVLAGRFAEMLMERLDRLASERARSDGRVGAATAVPIGGRAAPRVIAIGASTGGIHALSLMLGQIDAGCTAPILVTQHLPATFMPYFASQLSSVTGRPAFVAEDRMRIRPGHLYVAPGDAHLCCAAMTDGHAIRLDRNRADSGCMPSADPMFESVAAVFGATAMAVVLSGMGRDGSRGARRIVEAGGTLAAQDRESSVVWGMPGAVVGAGLAEAVMPPDAIGRLIRDRCGVPT